MLGKAPVELVEYARPRRFRRLGSQEHRSVKRALSVGTHTLSFVARAYTGALMRICRCSQSIYLHRSLCPLARPIYLHLLTMSRCCRFADHHRFTVADCAAIARRLQIAQSQRACAHVAGAARSADQSPTGSAALRGLANKTACAARGPLLVVTEKDRWRSRDVLVEHLGSWAPVAAVGELRLLSPAERCALDELARLVLARTGLPLG